MPCGCFLPLYRNYKQATVVGHQVALTKPLKKRIWQAIVRQKIINQAAILDVTGSDQFATVKDFAKLVKSGDRGVRLTLGANLQQYSTLGENDFARLQAGVARYDLLGRWEMRFAGGWDEVYFSGSEYQRVIGVDVRGFRALSKDRQLRLRYKLNRIQATDAIFDYLDGWRQQVRVAIRQRRGGNTLRAYYQLEVNDRQDRMGTIEPFSSYSPTRHSLRLTSWWRYGNGWRLWLDGRYRYSLYDGRNVLADGTRIRREDKQFRVSTRVEWRMAQHWGVSVGYYFTTNNSNIDRKGYDRSLFMLGLGWNY